MGNLVIGWPNRVDDATLSGGAWSGALPLSNVQNRNLWKVARSTDASTSSTKFSLDLSSSYSLRAFAFVNHNFSQAATWRITVGTTAGGSDLYDSGWQAVWHLAFDADKMQWGDVSLWEGVVDAGYTNHPYLAAHTMPFWLNARYVTIEVNDTTNSEGYVEFGRVFVGGGFEPVYNAQYGLQDGWDDLSTVEYSESGAMLHTPRRRRRWVKFSLGILSHTEAAVIHELIRRQGTTGEVLYIPDNTNQESLQRYGMLGRLRELSPLEYPFYATRGTGFTIEELL